MPYDRFFYELIENTARRSARVVVPIILRYTSPRSVIDVGCGLGTWLSVFRDFGVVETIGVDGPFFDRTHLQIPPECFVEFDLTKPFNYPRRFDLVTSLEVAEHLPGSSAEIFVDTLVKLAPVIVFSAAIPGQGGTNHVNEQWPEYWAQLFATRNFLPVDCIRRHIWKNTDVAWWYAQNTIIFCDQGHLRSDRVLSDEFDHGKDFPISLVHPRAFVQATFQYSLERGSRELTEIISRDVPFILVDNGEATLLFQDCSRVIPFPEHNGKFYGAPADDDLAIAELKRLCGQAKYLAIVSSAFWWLDYYVGWHDYLSSRFNLASRSEYLLLYDLQNS